MSSPNGNGSGGDRQSQVLTKFMRRASKVLRPRSQRSSVAGMSDIIGGESSATGGAVIAEVQPKTTPFAPAATKPITSSSAYTKEREEKARALFAKYGLKLEPGEWATPTTSDTPWVEKKVVMRVHRQCHRCQTAFGSEKTCANCSHTRCKKCPRFPSKRPNEAPRKEEGSAGGAAVGAGATVATGVLAVDPLHSAKSKPIQLTMPSRFRQECIRRDPAQRVRRTCHRCDALFVGKATECAGCKHQRCPKCPRDPPKTDKYPNGYPGDVEETFPLAPRNRKPIRLRFRWECHGCNASFVEHEKVCRQCQHERCEQCPRHPPKKAKPPPPDPGVLRSLEERLGKMAVSPTAAA